MNTLKQDPQTIHTSYIVRLCMLIPRVSWHYNFLNTLTLSLNTN